MLLEMAFRVKIPNSLERFVGPVEFPLESSQRPKPLSEVNNRP